MGSKVRKVQKLYKDDLDIMILDNLFVLALDSLTETEDVEMEEVMNTVGASDT